MAVVALGANQHVSVSGLNLRSGLDVRDCLGTVLFSDCSLTPQGLNQALSHHITPHDSPEDIHQNGFKIGVA